MWTALDGIYLAHVVNAKEQRMLVTPEIRTSRKCQILGRHLLKSASRFAEEIEKAQLLVARNIGGHKPQIP